MLNYDREVFVNQAMKAVLASQELVVGRTYYSNRWVGGRRLTAILSSNQLRQFPLFKNHRQESDEPRWMVFDSDTPNHTNLRSLKDTNIEASYNPWLLFESEADAEACRKALEISYH